MLRFNLQLVKAICHGGKASMFAGLSKFMRVSPAMHFDICNGTGPCPTTTCCPASGRTCVNQRHMNTSQLTWKGRHNISLRFVVCDGRSSASLRVQPVLQEPPPPFSELPLHVHHDVIAIFCVWKVEGPSDRTGTHWR